MLHNLLTHLYAHTTMTLDDILYIAVKHRIRIDASADDKLTASKDGEEITFDVTRYDDGTVFTFDI